MYIRKIFCVFVFVLFSFTPYLAKAEVIINEIKFNPTGERFVELYNNSSFIYVLFFVFLIVVSFVVYFVRFYARKNNKENEQDKGSEDGADFDILDE